MCPLLRAPTAIRIVQERSAARRMKASETSAMSSSEPRGRYQVRHRAREIPPPHTRAIFSDIPSLDLVEVYKGQLGPQSIKQTDPVDMFVTDHVGMFWEHSGSQTGYPRWQK